MAWDLEEAIGYYRRQGAPAEQSALISLLREVQQEQGAVSRGVLGCIAQAYGIKEGLLLALIRRIPSLRLSDTHTLELCAGPNCGKCAALANMAERIQKQNPQGFTLTYTPCMRQCGKGPNLRWDGKLYNKADEGLLKKLMENR